MLRSKRYRFVLIFRESFNGYLRCNDVFFGLSGHNLPLFPLYPVPEHRPFAAPAAVCAVFGCRLRSAAGLLPSGKRFRFFLSVLPLRFVFYFYWLYNPLHGNADCRRFVLAVKLYAAAAEIFLLLPMAELGKFGLVPAVCGRGAVCRRQSTRGKECSYSFRKVGSRIYGCCFERPAYPSRD